MKKRINSAMREGGDARRKARVVLTANKNRSCSHHKFTFEPSVEHTHQVPSRLHLEQPPLSYLPYPTDCDAAHDQRKQCQELNHSSSGGLVAVIANHLFYTISTDTSPNSDIKSPMSSQPSTIPHQAPSSTSSLQTPALLLLFHSRTLIAPALNSLPHLLTSQSSSVSLLSNDVFSPQECCSHSTTRTQHNGSDSHSRKYEDPGVIDHTGDFGVPGEVQEPEVCGRDSNEVVPLKQARRGGG